MARFTIYSKDGRDIRYVGEPQYNGSYMGVDYVEFRSVSCPIPIPWEIGDYVDYFRTGKRYKLYSLPMPNKMARANAYGGAFEYANVQLHGATKELEIAPFRDLASYDNTIHFSTRPEVSTYENVYGIARRIQECINDIFPHRWRIEVYDTDDADLLALFNETKEYSVSNGSCLDALTKVYETWKNVGWVHTYDSANDVDVITIGKSNVRTSDNTSDLFTYGKGNLLTSIKKASANEGEFATRIYVYGSERNIQTRYYNGFDILNKDSVDIRNLMIPLEAWGTTDGVPDARKAYLQAEDAVVEKYGIIPRTVYFDGTEHEEIYPSIVGLTMSRVRQAMIDLGQGDSEYLPDDKSYRIDTIDESFSAPYDEGTKEQTEKNMTFRLGLYQMGFNVAEQGRLTTEGYATISMKTGMCAGREFKVRKYADISYEKSDGTKCLVYEIERNWDESIGMGFPNKFYPIKTGDEFVLLDIPMPDFYIDLAEDDLLEAGQKLLKDYTKDSVFYEPSINAIKIKEGGKPLYAGMFMQIKDEDIIDTEDNVDYILIDTLTIDEKSELPQYKVTLRDQKRSTRTFSALENMIEDAKEDARQLIKRERQYTERRFRSAQETLDMLANAFDDFSTGIDPVTIKTMATLVGNESLQFIFTNNIDSLDAIPCPISYDVERKQMKGYASALVHMTLGIDDVTIKPARDVSDYKRWDISAWSSAMLDEGNQAYYVYVKAGFTSMEAEYMLSQEPRKMYDEEYDEDNYYFLVGVLNSEAAGTREFVKIYGFTEILPGQISTNVIRSADGQTYFDLANNEIGGVIKFKTGSEGLENLGTIGGQNLLRNSGFTGDYLSEELADEDALVAQSQLFSSPLDYWSISSVAVAANSNAESGYGVVFTEGGSLSQELYYDLVANENYILSFRGSSESNSIVVCTIGNQVSSVTLTNNEERYVIKVTVGVRSNFFSIVSNDCKLWDIQLERGSVSSSWGQSFLDNSSDRTYYQSMKYLQNAFKGVTEIAGGVVLTEQIQVGDYDTENKEWVKMNGGMSGVYESDNDVAFWAGGDFKQAVETSMKYEDDPAYQPTKEELAAMANFVVTHGGRAILNEAIVRGSVYANEGNFGQGCTIGDTVRIVGGGFEIDSHVNDIEGEIHIDESNGISCSNTKFYASLGGSGCGNSMLSVGTVSSGGVCPNNPTPIIVSGDTDAIYCHKGSFAGLRPKCCHIDELYYNGGYYLRDDIFSVLFPSSGTYNLNLDNLFVGNLNHPEHGQEIWLETMGANINITSTIPMWAHYAAQYQTSHTFSSSGVIRFKYYGAFNGQPNGIWTYSWVETK